MVSPWHVNDSVCYDGLLAGHVMFSATVSVRQNEPILNTEL